MRLRKYKKPRKIRKTILVICEGETERAYIEMLKRDYRLPVTIKSKVVGNKINKRLINQYLKELQVEYSEDVVIVFVYDSDVETIVDRLKELNGLLILSNPCIELWFLLHAGNQERSISSDDVVKLLISSSSEWQNYNKGLLSTKQVETLLRDKKDAIERARKLQWPNNPSSNMYQFIEILENEKNA